MAAHCVRWDALGARGEGPDQDDVSRRAGIAQLVERNLAKVEVAGSSPVARSEMVQVRGLTTKRGRSSVG